MHVTFWKRQSLIYFHKGQSIIILKYLFEIHEFCIYHFKSKKKCILERIFQNYFCLSKLLFRYLLPTEHSLI